MQFIGVIPWIAPTCCPLTFCPEAGILIEKRLISVAHHGMPLNMQKGMCMQPPLPSRHEKLGTSTCQKSFKLFGPIVAYPQKPTARCSDGFPQVRSTALPKAAMHVIKSPLNLFCSPILSTPAKWHSACRLGRLRIPASRSRQHFAKEGSSVSSYFSKSEQWNGNSVKHP